jgi:hypothetical protein
MIIALSGTIYFMAANGIVYLIYNFLSAACMGIHFASFAAFFPKKFGIVYIIY